MFTETLSLRTLDDCEFFPLKSWNRPFGEKFPVKNNLLCDTMAKTYQSKNTTNVCNVHT